MTDTRYATPPPADLILAWKSVFERQKAFCEHAFEQVSDADFFRPGEGLNSIAVIAQHMAGNLHSRFTDFLTTDGEKPWRDREAEFAPPHAPAMRAEIMTAWVTGWMKLFRTLESLTPEDVSREVVIRSVPHTVPMAMARALDHYSFHTGQINVIARMFVGTNNWKWFTLAPGATRAFNEKLMNKSESSE